MRALQAMKNAQTLPSWMQRVMLVDLIDRPELMRHCERGELEIGMPTKWDGEGEEQRDCIERVTFICS